MSGQPLRKPSDASLFRQEYLEALGLQTNINDMNFEANKVYKQTGQLPPASQMPDTRTPEEKMKDVVGLKASIIKSITPLSSSQFGQMFIDEIEKSPFNTNNTLLIFVAQRIEELMEQLKKNYAVGIKGDINDAIQMVKLYEDMYKRMKSGTITTRAFLNRPTEQKNVENYLQEISQMADSYQQDVILGIRAIGARILSPRIINLSEQIAGRLSDLKLIAFNYLPSYKQVLDLLQGEINEASMSKATRRQFEALLANYDELLEYYNELPDTSSFQVLLKNVRSFIKYRDAEAIIDTLKRIEEILPCQLVGNTGYAASNARASYAYEQIMKDPEIKKMIQERMSIVRGPSIPGINAPPSTSTSVPSSSPISAPTPVSGGPKEELDQAIKQRIEDEITTIEMGVEMGRLRAQDASTYFGRVSLPRILEDLIAQYPDLTEAEIRTEIEQAHANLQRRESRMQEDFEESKEDIPPLSDVSSTLNRIREQVRAFNPEEEPEPRRNVPVPTLPPTRPRMVGFPAESPAEIQRGNLTTQFGTDEDIAIEITSLQNPDFIRFLEKIKTLLPTQSDERDDIDAIIGDIANRFMYTDYIVELFRKYVPSTYKKGDYQIGGFGVKRLRGRPKGSVMPKVPFQAKIATGEGIKSGPRFTPFGKYVLDKNNLMQDVITMKTMKGTNIIGFPNKKVSRKLGDVFRKMSGGMIPSFDEMASLDEDEKKYLHSVAKKSNLLDKISVPTPNKDERERDLHQFEVMKGEIMSGNDNKEFIKKFKILLMKLQKNNELPKREVNEILGDLAELGY